MEKCAAYLSAEELETLQRALAYAAAAHAGFTRKSGAAYIEHPVAAASLLADWRAPTAVLAAGLLHDTLKPAYARVPPPDEICRIFGREIAHFVQEVSNMGRLGNIYPAVRPDDEEAGESLPDRLSWVALVLQRSPMAAVIKFADRLQNFESIDVHHQERQLEFATHTMHIFAPLAERMGMRAVKRQLEDYAFQILNPDAYGRVARRYPWPERKQAAAGIVQQLHEKLQSAGIHAEVFPNPHSFYNIYQYETIRDKQFPPELVQPIVIVTENSGQCYHVLGLVHALWPPDPEQFRDFIAAPKKNGYRAIHTQLRFSPRHNLIVLIRDRQMQIVAEKGITARWHGVPPDLLPSFPRRADALPGNISVLTPDGDLIVLPEGATVIDFAYAVHQGVGHQAIGAVVNGKMAFLSQELNSGDIVQVRVSNASVGPSPEWLSIIKTPKARSAIRRWIRAQNPVEATDQGYKMLEKRLRQEGVILASARASRRLQVVAGKLGYAARDDLLVAIGLGQRDVAQVAEQMIGQNSPNEAAPSLQATIVSLADADLPHRFAGCCNPLPPDPIMGYVTRDNVVKIHRADCLRARRLRPLLNAEWVTFDVDWQAEINILAIDRPRLVYDVSKIVAEMGLSMNSFYADRIADGSAQLRIGVGQLPQTQLEMLLKRLHKVPDVRQAVVESPQLPVQYNERSVLARHFGNPYTLRPATGSGFFGRKRELLELVNNLRDVRPGEAVLLWGPRRIGKTSLLLEFKQTVVGGDDFLPVFVDLQRLSGRSTTMFLHDIAREIVKALDMPSVKPPNLSRMKKDPLGYFRGFLENVPALQERLLVLIFDEFQLLGELREENVSLVDINRYFRGMIQHQQGLSIVFSGGGVLDSLLRHPETSFMLEVARHQKLDCLDEESARRLIVEPVPRVHYEETAVAQLLHLTAGHPYFLQWICSELVSQVDNIRQSTITTTLVDQVLTAWVPDQGEQFFNHLWGHTIGFDRQTELYNKLVLTSMAGSEPSGDKAAVPFTVLFRNGLEGILTEDQARYVLDGLVKMDTLIVTGSEQYRIKVPLCQHWLRQNYDVQHVVKEAARAALL
jgi:GTP pyrophosphokinase